MTTQATRRELIARQLRAAVETANDYAVEGYQPEALEELDVEWKLKMTRAELRRYGLAKTIPADLFTR